MDIDPMARPPFVRLSVRREAGADPRLGAPSSRPRSLRSLSAALLLVLTLALALVSRAEAAPLFTWTGGAAADSPGWATGINWEGATAPSLAEPVALEFPRLTNCTSTSPSEACYYSENNLGDLAVESISIDNGDDYELEGEGVTLGAGGLTAAPASGTSGFTGDILGLPIDLGAAQTWSVAGRGGSLLDEEGGVLLGGELSGAEHELTVDMSDVATLYFANEAEVGPLAIDGADTNKAGIFNGVVLLEGVGLNIDNGHAVSLGHVFAIGSGELGALSLDDAELDVGSGGEPAEGIVVSSSTFDAASEVTFGIHATGTIAGVDYSQLDSEGATQLGGALEVVVGPPKAGAACPSLSVGQEYTLIESLGAISGSFSNAAEGAELPIVFSKTCTPRSTLHLRIAYHRSDVVQKVTATVVGPHEEPASQEGPEHEEAPKSGESPSEISQKIASERAHAIAEETERERTEKLAREAAERQAHEGIVASEVPSTFAEPEPGGVSLVGETVAVSSSGGASVKLACAGGERCTGELELIGKRSSEGKDTRKGSRTVLLGSAKFSLAAGRRAGVEIELTAAGRALLRAGHGRLDARLTIRESAPQQGESRTRGVRLLAQPKRPRTSDRKT
jgi:hypothetical protein